MDPHLSLCAQLIELAAAGLKAPHVPLQVWRAIGQVVPHTAVEIIIMREQCEILLVHRDDEFWHGWHLPGGFLACGESIAQACDRIARRELGVGIQGVSMFDSFGWPDHPHGNVVSILCRCTPLEAPKAGDFFAQAPRDLVRHHEEFFALAQRQGSESELSGGPLT
jgi:ADP-ribose pyrophosphatase YjhB (NUDIX family)